MIVLYDRYFNVPTAAPGDVVTVVIKISFYPPGTSPGIWFNNVGDNLGGSKSTNGPLIGWAQQPLRIEENITIHGFHEKVSGELGGEGCYRYWCKGTTYPGPNNYHNDVFHPTSGPAQCSLTVIKNFTVHPNAVPGTIIHLPTRTSPCVDTNYDANELMISLGTSMDPFIVINTTPPFGGSRTLTIL